MSEADKFDVLEKIGHGSFGVIRKVRRKTDGEILCRKEISYIRMSTKERDQLNAEFSILSSLRHPNIVAYYKREHLRATHELHLYMEYCGNGDLGRVIGQLKADNQFADEDFVWSIFAQLVTALYRCHYGVDPPEVGRNITTSGKPPKPKVPGTKGQVMILHRDLKPENVFLGEDNSVKLGDFGLSKIMHSQEFASTYVGTPFYMSPEICAAERYTLCSDIWSLGCIIYELCAKSPPFNARTHFQLVQKIKDGRYAPLPALYSPELRGVIQSCLQINPSRRPQTVELLNLPIVRLMRKEKEVVDLGKVLRAKEELSQQHLKECQEREERAASDLETMRHELEASLRREWELKARLEIDRQVQAETERLRRVFEKEVHERVQTEISKYIAQKSAEQETSTAPKIELPTWWGRDLDESELPSLPDLTNLSLESPNSADAEVHKKGTRTPFGRSQTMFVGSPMDVLMIDPSPMSIASLSLSPRRQARAMGGGRILFGPAAEKGQAPTTILYPHSEDDREAPNTLPSPSEQRAFSAAARMPRPRMITQKTAPVTKLGQPSGTSGLRSEESVAKTALGGTDSHPDSEMAPASTAPIRGLSQLPPGTAPLIDATGSPVRRANRPISAAPGPGPRPSGNDMFRAVARQNLMRGRTLVELAQARAGGHAAEQSKRAISRALEVVWDPEVEGENMPSPFLARGGRRIQHK
ncbi:MAG: G2-specific serine/threonine protein kinase [Phylliscum demangeonii]|nr:MAG: G2-specific serine/threonine protein kinase [Phylliscum demangeonii]